MANKKVHDIKRTKENKIRRIEKELKTNPNNSSARQALEFWMKNDKRDKKPKRHSKQDNSF